PNKASRCRRSGMIQHFEQRDGSNEESQGRLNEFKSSCQANSPVIAYRSWPIDLDGTEATCHPLLLFIDVLFFFSHVISSLNSFFKHVCRQPMVSLCGVTFPK